MHKKLALLAWQRILIPRRTVAQATQCLTCKIHSFIHYENLYSASSRLLLRSILARLKRSFKARVECVGKYPGEQSLCEFRQCFYSGRASLKPEERRRGMRI